jgi:uncharacterized protein (DUF2132 family)
MTNILKDPLHGKTLKSILEFLVARYGWLGLGRRIKIKCFQNDPSLSSSLVFLRKTPWAREKVEFLYLSTMHQDKAALFTDG